METVLKDISDRDTAEKWNQLLLEIKDDKDFQEFMIKKAENYIKIRGRRALRQKQKDILASME